MNTATMSNASPDQSRNLKPTLPGHPTHNAYSASPSQLTLQSDMPPGPMPQTYHPYQYVQQQHDPSTFQFSQPSYRPQPQLQTRHPQVAPPPPHMTPQQQLPSPTNSRKRRASELSGDSMLQGPPGNNLGGYSNQTGLMGPPSDMDPNVHTGNQQQQQPQQQQQQQHQHQHTQVQAPQQQQQHQPQNNQMPSPVVKKGRTNTPWTPGEEHRLKQLRDQGSSWSEIAKNFPNRTEGSVKKHWYKDMHYADFGADESTALLQAIKEYETNKWKVIGQKVGKPAKACEQFAKEQGWKV